MHISLPSWLALSAALPSATAFYPYHYGDDKPSNSRRTPQPLSGEDTANARSITLPIRRVPTSLRTRQNSYNIVNSKDPKQANSVAIDQDGGDLSYMVAVTIGSSKEEYHLLLDSAASNTWVMGQACQSDACKTHNTFGSQDSSSLKTQDKTFSVSYGTGSVSGNLATDTFHIGSLSPPVTFGLATNVSQEFKSYPMDGILGIGRGVYVEGTVDAPQLMDVLASNKLITSKIYGVYLSRAKDNFADGELNLGQVNKDRFSGDLNWSPILDNSAGFWEIPVDNAGVDGKQLNLGARSAIVDTGTSFILMPQPDAVKLHAAIQGSKQDGETFTVPCDTTAIVQFSFNKQTYNISTPDWRGGRLSSGMCRSNIIGRQAFSSTQWLVGDVFLKNVYSVFDYDNKRLGLGVKSSSSSSASSPSSGAGSAQNTKPPTTTTAPLQSTSPRAQSDGISGSSAQPDASTAAEAARPQGQKTSGAMEIYPSPILLGSIVGLLVSLYV